jgi:hypothetical protein
MLARIRTTLLVLCTLFALNVQARAASTTLGNLSAGAAILGTDLFYDVQSVGAGGVKVTGTQMGTFIWALGGATTSASTATFSSSALLVKGSSTGTTAFASANAGASNFTITFPAATGTVALTANANVSAVSNSDGTLTISPTTGAVVASLALGHANTWTAVQTFTNSDIALLGSSTGVTTFTSANAGASNFTITVPAATGTIALAANANVASVTNSDGTLTISPTTGAVVASLALGHNNTWTGVQTFTNSDLVLLGSSTGATTFTSANASASNFTVTLPAATGNLAYQVGAFVNGDCIKASGTAGGLADTGSACGAGGGSPGGANTNVQFNNSSAFGGDAGFTYGGNGQATLALGTITSNIKALSITGILNNVATTFDAPLFMNITNTASAANSALIDLQLSSGSFFSVLLGSNVDPTLRFSRAGSDGSPVSLEGGAALFSFLQASNVMVFLNGSGSSVFDGIYLNSTLNGSGAFGWTNGYSGADTNLSRDAAGVVDIGNGTIKDATGALKTRTLIASGSTPTLTGTCTTATQLGGNTAGTFHATCTSQTVIITFAFTAPTGWVCNSTDLTTPADNLKQTSSTASSCTLTGTTVASDLIAFDARAF